MSRRWKQRKVIGQIELFIADELHLIGGDVGPTYEVIVSRMKYIAVQQERPIRIIGLSASLANGRDVGEWLGAVPGSSIFNFHPNARPVPLEVHIQSFSIPHFASMMLTMGKPAYTAIKNHSSAEKPTLIFVPSRKQARLTAAEMIAFAVADGNPTQFLNCTSEELE